MDLRATRAEINISQFKKNLTVFKNTIGKDKQLCLAVKGNAYGHGLIAMSYHAQGLVDVLAVATVQEGVSIREEGITLPIFVLSSHLEKEISILCRYHLIPMVSHGAFLEQYQYWASYYKMSLPLHLKVDTGMGRAGVMPTEALALAQKINSYPNLSLEGLCTHFATADSDTAFTHKQITLFNQIIQEFREHEINPPSIHAANSAGVLSSSESHFTLVRVGIGAYGYGDHPDLKPVMSLKSKILLEKIIPQGHPVSYDCTWIAPKDTKIGIVPVGYADGYFRALSNKAKVMIDGVLYPVLGKICMDQIVVALPIDGSYLEKDVYLYGDRPDLNAETLAEWAGTISYEIITAVSERVPRIYY